MERAHDQTPAAYMQVAGIVQSLALSYLAIQIFGNFGNGKFFVQDWVTLSLQYLCVFQLIVLTWHVNAQNSMAFKLFHRILDSYIPFLFAIPEYAMIETCHPLGTHLLAFFYCGFYDFRSWRSPLFMVNGRCKVFIRA